jgi:hypothetical protein
VKNIKIVLLNGKEYEFKNLSADEFIKKFADSNYKINKNFVYMRNGVYINPSHIIEIIESEEKEDKQELNAGGLISPNSTEMGELLNGIKLNTEALKLNTFDISKNLPKIAEFKMPNLKK